MEAEDQELKKLDGILNIIESEISSIQPQQIN